MSKNIYFKRIVCFLIVVFLIFSVGCEAVNPKTDTTQAPSLSDAPKQTQKPVATPEIPTENGTLKLSFSRFNTLNPLDADNRDVLTFMTLVNEPLFELGRLMEPVNKLADEFVRDETFKIWEISLKKGVSFSDGTELTARDVKATYDFAMKNGGNYAENVKNIAGTFEKDKYTVQFLLFEPDANFIGKLNLPILAANSCDKKTPVGTGLFKIDTEEKDTVLLSLNQNYHDETVKPHITSIEISVFNSEYEKMKSDFDISFIYGQNVTEYVLDGTRSVGYFTGDVYNYIVFNTTPTYMESETTTKTVDEVTVDENGQEIHTKKNVEDVKYYSFPNPFENAEMRRALNYMISRETVVNSAGAGNGTISLLPAYTGTVYRSQINADYEYNLFKAEECLRSAGFTKNEDGQWIDETGSRLTVKLLTIANNTKMCSIMRTVKKVLEECGIQTEYSAVSAAAYAKKLETKEFMLATVEIALPTWNDVAEIFKTDGTLNFSLWKSSKIDSYIDQLSTIDDYSVYNAAFERIEREVINENPIIGLYVSADAVLTGKRIGGVTVENFCVWNLTGDFCSWFVREQE